MDRNPSVVKIFETDSRVGTGVSVNSARGRHRNRSRGTPRIGDGTKSREGASNRLTPPGIALQRSRSIDTPSGDNLSKPTGNLTCASLNVDNTSPINSMGSRMASIGHSISSANHSVRNSTTTRRNTSLKSAGRTSETMQFDRRSVYKGSDQIIEEDDGNELMEPIGSLSSKNVVFSQG